MKASALDLRISKAKKKENFSESGSKKSVYSDVRFLHHPSAANLNNVLRLWKIDFQNCTIDEGAREAESEEEEAGKRENHAVEEVLRASS